MSENIKDLKRQIATLEKRVKDLEGLAEELARTDFFEALGVEDHIMRDE